MSPGVVRVVSAAPLETTGLSFLQLCSEGAPCAGGRVSQPGESIGEGDWVTQDPGTEQQEGIRAGAQGVQRPWGSKRLGPGGTKRCLEAAVVVGGDASLTPI